MGDRTKLGGEHRAPQLQRQRSPHDSFTSWGGLRPSSNGDEVRLRVLLLGGAFASASCLASSTTRAMASSTCEALNRTESLADAVTRQERGGAHWTTARRSIADVWRLVVCIAL